MLARKKLVVAEMVDARKSAIAGAAALAVTRDADEVWVAKGRQAVRVDLRTARPGRAEVLALLLGPTGALRAPTLRVGRTLLVGFNAEVYAKVLK